ncbi:deoxyribose-phosphate aldolase [Neolewinella lacunae]|uniref:Deoxyribose-phosphate aldolase n=1 Tax=Neolewinella lacunae TaxID=1517758 RepID=A0A923PJZ8_9BACT|nr:deoxyribose-phosphate aldolase [Neolewinella lacunae]MBC6994739.1 deoxyribose-phosphate aldolase [Neolewinella lacunae]MDN3634361.1 deoxyribose-phosphate aldolase [Neolewinella lacunae]
MNNLIDHTYLAPDCTGEDIERVCREAITHDFYAVCVPPFFIGRASKLLHGSSVKLATVIAFPYGYAETAVKIQEIRRAMDEGADELDIVINLSALKSGDWAYVTADLAAAATAVRLRGKVSKVIIEIGDLNEQERRKVCDICNEIKPNFVKTSTGTRGGAKVEDVLYLRAQLLPEIKIKASGGIRTRQMAEQLVAAGADRLGTSAGPALLG